MEIIAKENVISTVIEQELDAVIQEFWQHVPDMVIRPVVIALILNQLEPHYATSIRGRNHQITKISKQIQEIRQLVPEMVRKTKEVYNQETDKLLKQPINVMETIVKDQVTYVIENYHKKAKNPPIHQIEALTLNQLPHRYAATERGFNLLKLELNRNRPFKIEAIRRNAQICIYEHRIDEPITISVRTSVIFAQENSKNQKESKRERLRSREGNFGNII